MNQAQPGILADVPQAGRHLFFTVAPEADPSGALQALQALADGDATVVGLGESLMLALGSDIEEMRIFPSVVGQGFEVPSTPAALWCWLRGSDRGELLHRSRQIVQTIAPEFRPIRSVDVFKYDSGRDLTGYEDGTENPKDEDAVAAAIVAGKGVLDGSSFVAVQQWLHDLDHFQAMSPSEQDHSIGRERKSNDEIADAPTSAHIKRTAQENFSPAAFILRRSMPWNEGEKAGLMFIAFGQSFDAFEALLHCMVGADDGVADALFRFTRPITGNYFWCPAMLNDRLDLRPVGM